MLGLSPPALWVLMSPALAAAAVRGINAALMDRERAAPGEMVEATMGTPLKIISLMLQSLLQVILE